MKYRKSVFVVVYSKTKKGVEYLILKRKLHWIGWEFPKGGIKKFESKKRAVRREIKEETGLNPSKISRFNFSGKFNYDKKLTIPQNCCALCFKCNVEVNCNRKHWTKFFQSLLSERYGYQYSKEKEIIFSMFL